VVKDPRSLKRHLGPTEDFISSLEGHTLTHAVRRGKFLWFPIAGTNEALVGHLGMSGQMLIGDETSDFGPHARIIVTLKPVRGLRMQVAFVDQRIFGSLAIDHCVDCPDGKPGGLGSPTAEVPKSVAHIGRDPLDPHCDDRAVIAALRRKSTGIKRALLDQNLISGVGNIYADEALFASKLHYDTPCSSLSVSKVRELLRTIREVFGRALAEGGTSFDQQYVNVNGQSGYFSRSLKAYGRAGEPCVVCGAIIVRERFMNRSSYRCPRCQKVPSTR
jgi:formamidopyrimidine-DNA glycosylase